MQSARGDKTFVDSATIISMRNCTTRSCAVDDGDFVCENSSLSDSRPRWKVNCDVVGRENFFVEFRETFATHNSYNLPNLLVGHLDSIRQTRGYDSQQGLFYKDFTILLKTILFVSRGPVKRGGI